MKKLLRLRGKDFYVALVLTNEAVDERFLLGEISRILNPTSHNHRYLGHRFLVCVLIMVEVGGEKIFFLFFCGKWQPLIHFLIMNSTILKVAGAQGQFCQFFQSIVDQLFTISPFFIQHLIIHKQKSQLTNNTFINYC